jgi:hypothetical protein
MCCTIGARADIDHEVASRAYGNDESHLVRQADRIGLLEDRKRHMPVTELASDIWRRSDAGAPRDESKVPEVVSDD